MVTKTMVREKIISLLTEIMHKYDDQIKVNESFNMVDLNIDSILFISIVVDIESEFNIVIPDEYLNYESMTNIESIMNVVCDQLGINNNENISLS